MHGRKQTNLKENQPLSIYEKEEKEITAILDNISIPKNLANIIVGYNYINIGKLLSSKEMKEVRQNARKLDSHTMGYGKFFINSFSKFMSTALQGSREVCLFVAVLSLFPALTTATVQTSTRTHKAYNWNEVAALLMLLRHCSDDEVRQYTKRCARKYNTVKNGPTYPTWYVLQLLEGNPVYRNDPSPIDAIETFLKNSTNSNSRLYGILIKELKVTIYNFVNSQYQQNYDINQPIKFTEDESVNQEAGSKKSYRNF